jgi:hypothetical protein
MPFDKGPNGLLGWRWIPSTVQSGEKSREWIAVKIKNAVVAGVMASGIGFSSLTNATELTFAATYNQAMNFVGSDVLQNQSFNALSFNFTVSFDPQVTWLMPPTTTYSTYTGDNGSPVNYVWTGANTVYGQPTFSQSPVSTNAGYQYTQNQYLNNYSTSYGNAVYNYWDSQYTSYGGKPIGFSLNYQGQPAPNSPDYAVYFFEVATHFLPPPTSAAEVTNISPDTFLSYLLSARDQKAVWNLNEGGYYMGQDISSRTGSLYFGSATLVAIDGVAAPIPEPETYAMMLAGLSLLGLTAWRRRQKLTA